MRKNINKVLQIRAPENASPEYAHRFLPFTVVCAVPEEVGELAPNVKLRCEKETCELSGTFHVHKSDIFLSVIKGDPAFDIDEDSFPFVVSVSSCQCGISSLANAIYVELIKKDSQTPSYSFVVTEFFYIIADGAILREDEISIRETLDKVFVGDGKAFSTFLDENPFLPIAVETAK